MKLKVRILGLSAGRKPVVILNEDDAREIGVRGSSRVEISYGNKKIVGIVNLSKSLVKKGEIGFSEEVERRLKVKENESIEVNEAPFPVSVEYIREKLRGRRLSKEKIYQIVKDVVKGNLSEIEITGFVVALHSYGLSLEEAANLSLAMVKTGEVLKLDSIFWINIQLEEPLEIKLQLF